MLEKKIHQKTALVINPDGITKAINAPVCLSKIGISSKTRASHVIPEHELKKIAFKIFRKIFGDTGKISNWTRTWKGPWLIDFSPTIGGLYGPFLSREKALEVEYKKLKEWLIKQ